MHLCIGMCGDLLRACPCLKNQPVVVGASLKDHFASWWNGTELREADPGLIFPVGAEYVEELVSGYSLSSDETILEGRIGMGGNATTIVAKFGNYVTGYENDEKLAAEAKNQPLSSISTARSKSLAICLIWARSKPAIAALH